MKKYGGVDVKHQRVCVSSVAHVDQHVEVSGDFHRESGAYC